MIRGEPGTHDPGDDERQKQMSPSPGRLVREVKQKTTCEFIVYTVITRDVSIDGSSSISEGWDTFGGLEASVGHKDQYCPEAQLRCCKYLKMLRTSIAVATGVWVVVHNNVRFLHERTYCHKYCLISDSIQYGRGTFLCHSKWEIESNYFNRLSIMNELKLGACKHSCECCTVGREMLTERHVSRSFSTEGGLHCGWIGDDGLLHCHWMSAILSKE